MEFPFDPQRRQSPRGKAKLRSEPAMADRAQWTWPLKEVLLRLCHEQVVTIGLAKGNLSGWSWKAIKVSFHAKTGLVHEVGQLKNELQKLKKEYAFIVELLRHQTGAGLHPITGVLDQELDLWVAKDVEHKGKAMAYRFVDLRPYRDMGPAIFDGNLATGEYLIAPSKFSNTYHVVGEDLDDSDPDKAEGSDESGDGYPNEIPAYMGLPKMTGSGGFSGKQKRVIMATSSLVTGCRRRLAVTDMTNRSMQTTGKGKSTQVEAINDMIPSIFEVHEKISDLVKSNLDLHTHAVMLIENPVHRQILYGFTSTTARDAWLIATKNARTTGPP